MPYYTREMVRFLRMQEQMNAANLIYNEAKTEIGTSVDASDACRKSASSKQPLMCGEKMSSRILRVTPSCVDRDAAKGVSRFENAPPDSKTNAQNDKTPAAATGPLNFDEKRLLYMKNLLRLQVERIGRIEPHVSSTSKLLQKFEFDLTGDPLQIESRHKIYAAKNVDFPALPMVVRVIPEPLAATVSNAIYLKVLRHLGKKHPFVLQTWEIFAPTDERQSTLVLQEYANRRDMGTFISRARAAPPESQLVDWARQLFKALDYLGDMAICHRAICPRHVLLNHQDLGIRLSGFRNAVIYWDTKTEDIACVPCLPAAAKRGRAAPDYQAPEVYGDGAKEEFDPVCADAWSFAAVMYFAATKGEYPYDWQRDSATIEDEVCANVEKIAISVEGRQFLHALLRTNALARLHFNQIYHQPWFAKFQDKAKIVSSSSSSSTQSAAIKCDRNK